MTPNHLLLQRAWWRQWLYPLLFLCGLWLSLSTYLTLDAIQQSVQRYVDSNQKVLVGGDLILTSNQPWPPALREQLAAQDPKRIVYEHQFNAMLHNNAQSLLASIKAVTPSYPLYGEVELASGKPLWQQLTPDHIIVETQVLRGLGLQVGDQIDLGDATFTIADELTVEPDRPLTAFGFGARVLMRDGDLDKTNLIGQRSRVNYRIELVTNAEQAAILTEQLKPISDNDPAIDLSDAASADTSFTRISGNVLTFLKLLVVAVLILSGVGLLSVVKTFIQRQQRSNAIRRALGEPLRSIKHSYYALFTGMALLAAAGATAISTVMLNASRSQLNAILPADLALHLNLLSIGKITVLAIVITLLITWQSLHQIAYSKPVLLMQPNAHVAPQQRTPWLWYTSIVIALFLLLSLELSSFTRGGQITLSLLAITTVFRLLAQGWLAILKRIGKHTRIDWLTRLAITNIERKNNQSTLFFTTLAAAISVLSSVAILNRSIDRQLISNYPEDAPNLFLLDVQHDQHDTLNELIAASVTYYPVIRARIDNVNGISPRDIDGGTSITPTRVFNLSYAESVMDSEFIQSATRNGELYSATDDANIVPISILDTAADGLGVGLGDHIDFDVQGITIHGQITSIRERYERGPTPFFYFLFPIKVLQNAPQIQFATAKVDAARIVDLQTAIANTYSGITTINGAAIAQRLQSYVAQLTKLVSIFTVLALLAGLMVLITSLLSTAQDRLRDSAWFRLLGMKRADLYRINIVEICLLGYSAAALGVILAAAAAWYIIDHWFSLRFSIPWSDVILGFVALSAILITIAVTYTRFIITKRVMAKIRAMV